MTIIKKTIIISIMLFSFFNQVFTQEIHEAVKTGDVEKVKMLIEKDPTLLNARDNFNATPLHWAGIRCQREIFMFLCEKGADVNATENHGGTPMQWAAAWDNTDFIEKLISKGANINHQSNSGGSAIHYASRRGCFNVVKLLIEKGADVRLQRKIDKITPLFRAAANGHERIYNLLVQHGADENLVNKLGKSPKQAKNEFIHRKAIHIDPVVYDSYAGKYQAEGGAITEIEKKDNRLFLKFWLFREEIFPESQTKFFSKTENRQVTFITDKNKEVKEIVFTSERRTTRRKKLSNKKKVPKN
jgi:hypothetical protein